MLREASNVRWRVATWAILIWTGLMALWFFAWRSNETDSHLFSAVIGTISLFSLWFVGFIILVIYWFMSRPKHYRAVYGPKGQHVVVPEQEAKEWVEMEGWTYQPPQPYAGQQPSVAHMRSDMVTPRASADFLSRRAKREETQDDAPVADD
jgi:hypothetical protein